MTLMQRLVGSSTSNHSISIVKQTPTKVANQEATAQLPPQTPLPVSEASLYDEWWAAWKGWAEARLFQKRQSKDDTYKVCACDVVSTMLSFASDPNIHTCHSVLLDIKTACDHV